MMKSALLLCLVFTSFLVNASKVEVSGYVQSTKNEPIPYANVSVYIDRANDVDGEVVTTGATTDLNGYYALSLAPGVYRLVYQSLGFKDKVVILLVEDENIQKNVYLEEDAYELETVEIKGKRRDPAYEIMKQASKVKDDHLKSIQGSKSKIYIKSSIQQMSEEEQDLYINKNKKTKSDSTLAQEEEKRAKRKAWITGLFKKEKSDTVVVDSLALDSIKQDSITRAKNNPKQAREHFAEVIATRYFQYPNQIKEIRDGYKVAGSYWDMFYLTTADGELNFYESLISVPSLSDYQIMSPLNALADIPYSFELIESTVMFGKYVHRIKVTPRRPQTPLFEGEIVIADQTWEICQVDFKLDPYAINLYDYLEVHQQFEKNESGQLLMTHQSFTYVMGYSNSIGKTDVYYSDYQINPQFEEKFFNNALLITTQEAIDKDSTFWNTSRPKPLTVEEQKIVAYRDSIYAVTHSEAYLDSLDKVNNTYKVQSVFDGYQYYDREKNITYFLPSVWELVNPFMFAIIGGPRSSLSVGLEKQFEDKKELSLWSGLGYGYFNKDFTWQASSTYRYNPMKFAWCYVAAGNQINVISDNNYMSLEVLSPANFYREQSYSGGWGMELINGLYIGTNVDFSDNESLSDMRSPEYLENLYINSTAVGFESYRQLTSTVRLGIRPNQKYYLEPNRKINLGSKWPYFNIEWNRGWNEFGSEFRFNEVVFSFSQEIKLGLMGTSKYRFSSGKYLNYDEGGFINQNMFVAGDRVFFQHPLYGFSLLNTHQFTSDLYLEGHYIHHFNGAILNAIPLLKLLKIKAVVGASALYIKDTNLQHLEAFVGIEREVRIAGSRLKFGLFPVANVDNEGNPFNYGIRFGINSYSRQSNRWMY